MWWDGNRKITPEQFQLLYDDFIAHARGKQLFAQDLYGGADPKYRIRTRVFTELAWHSLFIRTLLIRPDRADLAGFVPELTIVDLPSFKADPKRHGVRSETVIAIDFTKKIVLIGGSSYAGEMKKSVFTTLNFYLPAQGVMPMHCSANVGPAGDVSAVLRPFRAPARPRSRPIPARTLIGDDEHGWGPDGVFNFEGGCYAKTIKLSARSRARNLRGVTPLRRRAGKRGVRPDHAHSRLRRRFRRPRIPAPPIRSTSSRMRRAPAAPATPRTSSCSPPTRLA